MSDPIANLHTALDARTRCILCRRQRQEHQAPGHHCPIGHKHRTYGFTAYSRTAVFTPKPVTQAASLSPPATETTVNQVNAQQQSTPQQHGGPRTPKPGHKLGRPTKKPKEKATCTTITLSSPKSLKTLQSRARKAKLRPGAYIERELKL